jgi:hemolysin III
MVDVAALLLLIPACLLLVRDAPAGLFTFAALVYSVGVLSMVGASALYHAPRWPKSLLPWFQKLDFAAIYLLIAGTYTPVCLFVLGEPGKLMLVATWTIASLGVLKAFFWSHAPRWLRAGIYVAFGWMVLPHADVLWQTAGIPFVTLIGVGGLLYSLSALVYVKRWGNFRPAVWGYHESMHALVVSAVGCHFAAMWTLLVAS